MASFCPRRSFAYWIAFFAILLASLAQPISHLLAASGHSNSEAWLQYALASPFKTSSGEAEICHGSESPPDGSAGHKHAEVEPSVKQGHTSTGGHSEQAFHFEHCPFCFTHAGSFTIEPHSYFFLPLVRDLSVRPELFYVSTYPLFSWAAAHARGPPALV